MILALLSDTHGKHRSVNVPECDIVLHAGDVSHFGDKAAVHDFVEWLYEQPARYKVFIAGNMDYFAEAHESLLRSMLPPGVFYLQNESLTLGGITLYGAPQTPRYHNTAFNVNRGKALAAYWQHIPDDTDILITHGPPYGILDTTRYGEQVGDRMLAEHVLRVSPKLHLFGHIHEASGQHETDRTRYVNAAIVDADYRPVKSPVLLDWAAL